MFVSGQALRGSSRVQGGPDARGGGDTPCGDPCSPVTSCRASDVFLYTRFQGFRKVSIDPFLHRMSTPVRQVRLNPAGLVTAHSRAQAGAGPSQHASPAGNAE